MLLNEVLSEHNLFFLHLEKPMEQPLAKSSLSQVEASLSPHDTFTIHSE
jgi:hypothetical protein